MKIDLDENELCAIRLSLSLSLKQLHFLGTSLDNKDLLELNSIFLEIFKKLPKGT